MCAHGYDALHYGELRHAQKAHKDELMAEKPSRNKGETGVTNRKYPSNEDEINAAKHPCTFAIARSASPPPNRAALVSSGPQAWNRKCRACVDQDSTYCVPRYDNPGSSVGLTLGSGVYAGNVINEYRGQTQKLRFLRYPLLIPPIQEKTNPQVGLFFIACKWALRV